MKANGNNLSKASMQSLGLAVIVIIAEVLVYSSVIVKGLVKPEVMNSSLGFFIVSALNTVCCFFIVKYNPISILFVPLVINTFILAMAFFNTAFGIDPWWVPVVSGWLVCIMSSIIGALIRKRTSKSHIQLERG